MLEYMDVMDIVVSDVLKTVYAQVFATLMKIRIFVRKIIANLFLI